MRESGHESGVSKPGVIGVSRRTDIPAFSANVVMRGGNSDATLKGAQPDDVLAPEGDRRWNAR